MNEDETTEVETNEEETDESQSDKTFTQAELDKIVENRLARERKKYANHDELQAAAAELAELKKAQLSEIELANQERDAALAEVEALKGNALKSALREAARDAGLDPVGALDALNGSASDLLDPSDMAGTMEKLLADRPSLKVDQKQPTPSADQGARGGHAGQITAEQLKNMTPQQIVDARQQGLLKNLTG